MNGANLCLKDPLLPGQLLWLQLLKLEEAHIHQPTSWPVPHACACVQPYHAGSGSHRQLFHHRVKEQRKPVSLIAVGSAKHSFKHQLHTTGPRHGSFPTTHREVGSWVGVCVPVPCFKFVLWKWWTKAFHWIKNLKSQLYYILFCFQDTINFDANEYPPDDWLMRGWAQDSQTRTRLMDFVSRVCSKTMHSLFCITS